MARFKAMLSTPDNMNTSDRFTTQSLIFVYLKSMCYLKQKLNYRCQKLIYIQAIFQKKRNMQILLSIKHHHKSHG